MTRRRSRPNAVGFLLAVVWLAVIVVPLWFLVSASLRTRETYLSDDPLSWPTDPTLENYRTVLDGGFDRYLLNTVVVTAAVVGIVLVLGLLAGYAISRSDSPFVQRGFSMLLIGLAIPSQAVIIPVYLIITKLHLYDTLIAIILPTAAFALPVSTLVLANSLRDVPVELYEAQEMDGAGPGRMMFTLVLPLARPALITVAVYAGQQAWIGFLFPVVLTQSESQRVLTQALWSFQGQFSSNTPAVLAAVTLSVLPIFVLYLMGRRFLVGGLTAGLGR